ncbi:MAG: PTS sugar transporter subunit IIA [Acidimicrobiia bacterium]|nr:PTS sugar transporter subunit IIA [Acidimicrobiia bacterium]
MGTEILDRKYIRLGCESVDMDSAVATAGALLAERGLVTDDYVVAMHDREATVSTFLGNGVALPHGTFEAKGEVLGTGIVVSQYPEGVEWSNGTAHLVIGLAAQGEDHVTVLSQLADVLQDEELAEKLWTADDVDFVYATLMGDQAE